MAAVLAQESVPGFQTREAVHAEYQAAVVGAVDVAPAPAQGQGAGGHGA